VSIGGAPSQSNEVLLNGVPDMTAQRKVSYSPPLDAVSEVKVEAFQADASFGDTAGGTINVTTKSGTNEFHGTLYEFNQTSALAATPFFTKLAGLKNSVTRYNQYGGTIGGPVWIPKVYNGKNQVFFFFMKA
jgi:outer membrane receptor for Fe3+-dicitrate